MTIQENRMICDEFYHYTILNEENKDSLENFIFNYLTEESSIEIEDESVSVDEFLMGWITG